MELSQEICKLDDLLIDKYKVVKKRKKGETFEYINLVASFDIETSSFYEKKEKRAIMYAYGLGIDGKVKIGRTREEFIADLEVIKKHYDISLKKRLIIYVHNLSYEFQFMRKRFKWNKVFALDTREVCYALTDSGFEFRCSYILSNSSLANLSNQLTKFKIKKLVGDLDYSKLRNAKTPLSEKELHYLLNDCLVVMAYIAEQIENEKSIIYLPLTNTGFVRNYCKKHTISVKENYKYRGLIRRLKLSEETYLMLQNAFMGGFTHASHLWTVGICKNVSSYDLTSSYPTVLCSELFPMGKGYKITIYSREGLFNLMEKYCVLLDVTYIDIKEDFTYEHYISESKCFEKENLVLDNGRVVSADKIRIILTDIDFKIIEKTYKYKEFKVNSCYIFKKEYLPKEFISCILDFYEKKTTLKEVEGKEVEYMRSKNQINSLYGMCVTNPCRDEILYEDDEWGELAPDVEKTLEKYNNSKSRFLFYAWGIWCTAYARNNLWKAIYNLKNDYIYSDTDSVKIFNIDKHREFFEEYNKDIINKLTACLNYYSLPLEKIHPKNSKGEEKYLGVWDYEGSYDMFKTLGAKRYMMSQGDTLKITIAGVNKKTGVEYLKYKYKSMYNIFTHFDNDLVFPATYNDNGEEKQGSGKNTLTYLDEEQVGYVTDYLGNTCKYHELSSIHLEATSYSLSMADIYLNYLKGVKGDYVWKSKNTTLLLT